MIWQNVVASGLITLSGIIAAFVATLRPEHPRTKLVSFVIIILSTVAATSLNTWGQAISSNQQAARQKNRIEIQNEFADLIEEGQIVESAVLNPSLGDDPVKAFKMWNGRTVKFLQEKLGRVYVLQYSSNTGLLPVGPVGINSNSPEGMLWSQVHNRLEHLNQFSAQIPPVD